MTEQIHLTQRERQVYFYKLLALYVAGLLLFAFILFWKAARTMRGSNNDWQAAYAENELVMEKQFTAVRYIDSMAANMTAMRGEARQVFLERDVENLIRQTRALYDDHKADLRYTAFLQAGELMTMRLEDLQTLRKKLDNVRMFEKQLNECQIGYRTQQR